MDETGFQLDPARGWTLCTRGRKTVIAMSSGNRDHVTVIQAVAANGFAILPFFFFQGKRRSEELHSAVINDGSMKRGEERERKKERKQE